MRVITLVCFLSVIVLSSGQCTEPGSNGFCTLRAWLEDYINNKVGSSGSLRAQLEDYINNKVGSSGSLRAQLEDYINNKVGSSGSLRAQLTASIDSTETDLTTSINDAKTEIIQAFDVGSSASFVQEVLISGKTIPIVCTPEADGGLLTVLRDTVETQMDKIAPYIKKTQKLRSAKSTFKKGTIAQESNYPIKACNFYIRAYQDLVEACRVDAGNDDDD
eukprot:TRINITY_DN403_c0_g1_i1.p1 TRINITY_DN403_c0_g1~~TRINITY_DN403_c0_g1_i1.p1  ORF type:complete len:219 (+),score=46.73 TRINITY_DN403_c0_g1_i1:101-757(+)